MDIAIKSFLNLLPNAIKQPKNKLQSRIRFYFGWAFAITLVLTAHTNPNIIGIFICFLGATLRVWSSSIIKKNKQLAVSGPYSYTRNPLYFGSYIMGMGAALAYQEWLLLISSCIGFAIIYHYVILREETKLYELFGEPFLKFCQLVPRFFPKFWKVPKKELAEINPTNNFVGLQFFIKNKFYEAYLAFLGLVSVPYLFILLKQHAS